MNDKNTNNKDIVNRTEIFIIITSILLMITGAAKLPQSSHAISINYTELNRSYEQYKIIKQVADDNAFSNLSRSLSPPTGAGNVTSTTTSNSTS